MELINRYIEEVGTYLPRALQEDVKRELRSNLEEALEARSAKDPAQSEEEMEVAILRELGPPHRLAESYLPKPNILFGPRLYPAFLLTMKIALTVLGLLVVWRLLVEFLGSPSVAEFGLAVLDAADGLLKAAIMLFGLVVIVFVVIERTTRESLKEEVWDPRSLPVVDDPDKISRIGEAAKIVCLVVALVVVNLFGDRLGALVTISGESGWIPFLGEAFRSQLWLFNLCLGLELASSFLVLRRGRLSTPLRWLNLGISAVWITWLYRLAFGPPFVEADPQWMLAHGWSEEAVQRYAEIAKGFLGRVTTIALRGVLFFAALGAVVDLFKVVRRSFFAGYSSAP